MGKCQKVIKKLLKNFVKIGKIKQIAGLATKETTMKNFGIVTGKLEIIKPLAYNNGYKRFEFKVGSKVLRNKVSCPTGYDIESLQGKNVIATFASHCGKFNLVSLTIASYKPSLREK